MKAVNEKQDVHTCGDCRSQFTALEEFLHHKVHVEHHRLLYCPSPRDPSISVPHFLPSNIDGATSSLCLKNAHESKAQEPPACDRTAHVCQVCGRTFSKARYVQRHFDLTHQELSPFKCSRCSASFKKRQTLKVHWLQHSDTRSFGCVYSGCHCAFKTKGSLVRHVRYHTGERPFACQQCNRRFAEAGALSRHLKSCTVSFQKVDAVFTNTTDSFHQNVIAAGEEFKGTQPEAVDSENKMEIEENTAFGVAVVPDDSFFATAEKTPHCPVCGKEFRLKDSSRKHSLCHSQERRYACNTCSKTFKRSSHVKEHLSIHEERKPHPCQICGRPFASSRSLKSHLSTHNPELQYGCSLCTNRFRTKHSMLRHLATHKKTSAAVYEESCSSGAGIGRDTNPHSGRKTLVVDENAGPGKTSMVAAKNR